ncbi:hypothetical protein ANN_02302 [Periplaneta americana]|uniref:Uncharacterized protein n=1 Tax=Periplaneta americana TaxID=6978 RepID=A0ABQ8U043_PERAM|nr:hypothetical protein ANN_02302 [Periplaneta americana]
MAGLLDHTDLSLLTVQASRVSNIRNPTISAAPLAKQVACVWLHFHEAVVSIPLFSEVLITAQESNRLVDEVACEFFEILCLSLGGFMQYFFHFSCKRCFISLDPESKRFNTNTDSEVQHRKLPSICSYWVEGKPRKKPQPGNLLLPGIEPGPPGFAARSTNRYSTGLDSSGGGGGGHNDDNDE